MKKRKEYTFLEWVFDVVGLAKFFLYYLAFGLIVAFMILSFMWWYTKR
jgi:hypothetical protein